MINYKLITPIAKEDRYSKRTYQITALKAGLMLS